MINFIPVNHRPVPVSALLVLLVLALSLGGCVTQPKSEIVDMPSDVFMQFMARAAPKDSFSFVISAVNSWNSCLGSLVDT